MLSRDKEPHPSLAAGRENQPDLQHLWGAAAATHLPPFLLKQDIPAGNISPGEVLGLQTILISPAAPPGPDPPGIAEEKPWGATVGTGRG